MPLQDMSGLTVPSIAPKQAPNDPNKAAPITTAGILSFFFLQGMVWTKGTESGVSTEEQRLCTAQKR